MPFLLVLVIGRGHQGDGAAGVEEGAAEAGGGLTQQHVEALHGSILDIVVAGLLQVLETHAVNLEKNTI